MLAFTAAQYFVHDILQAVALGDGDHLQWSLQGFGMLRLYLTKELRLHIWDSRFQVKNVTLLHDHPWDFESLVLSGEMTNIRYTKPLAPSFAQTSEAYWKQKIVCGEGGGCAAEPERVQLTQVGIDIVRTGQTYRQHAEQIHASEYEDGTVTLIQRRFREDTEHAHVFYKDKWVSAEPRRATPEEVRTIVEGALSRWRTIK